MSARSVSSHLPEYQAFVDVISPLNLPMSCSELHGMMCGFLCTGVSEKGEEYLRALMLNKNDELSKAAILALHDVYTVSHQQIVNLDFEFQLMLPNDNVPLPIRAQAFSEWCDGFTQGLAIAGLSLQHIEDDELLDAIQHIKDFSQLDYENLHVDENDEKALVEVSEYTRLAVLHIYSDLKQNNQQGEDSKQAH